MAMSTLKERKMSKKNKVYEYSDAYNDDFATTKLDRPSISEDYVYIRKGKIKCFLAALLYYLVAVPILWIISKLVLSTKVVGKKNARKLSKSGYCIYSNHTHYFDAFVPQVFVGFPKRTNVLAYSDALSIPVIKHIVKALGIIPVEKNPKSLIKMTEAINYYLDKNEAILIYPEGHIWPYYNGVRPLKSGPFRYPALKHLPMLAICSVWRKVWYSKKPKQTIYISEPFLYDENLNEHENCDQYAKKTLEFYTKIMSEHGLYHYIEYIKKNN